MSDQTAVPSARSDDTATLRAMLMRPGVVHEIQCAATAAHARARNLPWATQWALDQEWNSFRHRTHAADRVPYAETTGQKQQREMVVLRIAIEARQFFDRYTAEHARMNDEQRSAAYRADGGRRRAASQRELDAHIASVAAMRPQFSVADCVAGLQARGIALAAEGDALVARPIAKLTDSDRAMLRTHKAAILATMIGPGEAF